jgi:hypothetical protein
MRICGVFRFTGQLDEKLVQGPLLIDGSEPKFFIDALRKSVRCQRVQATEELEVWRLGFFADTRFACQFLVAQRMVREGEDLRRGNSLLFEDLCKQFHFDRAAAPLIDSARLCLQVADCNEASAMAASLFMRGSKALSQAEFSERSGRHLAIGARGMAMISNNESLLPMFQRYCVLLSLLRAYQYAIDLALTSLADLAAQSESVAANEALSNLRRDTLVFSARFLFLRPVRLDTVDLRYVWENLATANHLSDTHSELTEQLNAVHALVQFDHDQREEKRDRRVQSWLAWLGILLAAVALLEVTPFKLKEFWAAWFGL